MAPPTDAPAITDGAAVAAPTAPDVTDAVAQLGSANVNVSIRIASPGDNGDVSQTVSNVAATTAAAATQADTAPSTDAQTTVTQAAPTNVNVSVRVASPGADGPVTQTVGAASVTAQQYQPAPAQYQTPAEPMASQPATVAPIASAPPPAPSASPAPALPSSWTWNWTWLCGDTTAPGITQTVDTGIQDWIWTWTRGDTCGIETPSLPNITPITQTQSPVVILPVVAPAPPMPVPPSAPAAPEVVAPVPPVPPAPAEAPPALIELPPALVSPELVSPALVSPAPLTVVPVGGESGASLSLPRLAAPLGSPGPSALTPATAAGAAGAQFSPLHIRHAIAQARIEPSAPSAPSRTTRHSKTLYFSGGLTAGGGEVPPGSGGGGGGGSGGVGVTAALAAWLLLSLPWATVLRLPAGRRAPRAPVEEIPVRPG